MMAWFDALIERRLFRRGVPLAILVLLAGVIAAGAALGTTTTCSNTATLAGSAFEIDTNANQVVNTTGCIDWLDTDATQAGQQHGAIIKQDTQTGPTDESFGEGTKEDTAQPTVVDGGIPPNKSDLKAFGVFTESGEVTTANPTGKFLELLWTRVQDPSGTTNMDFELNQKFCDLSATPTNCASNGITPLRTTGDKLITYDLSRGGTRATISIRTWNGTSWGAPTVLTDQNPVLALGTINTTQITAANSLSQLGALSPRTFGEASIAFSALFGTNTCGQFGSAYLKSRSSDSFQAALKDFVPPQQVTISNCAAITTDSTNSVTIGDPISDDATLSGVTNNAGGTITFHLFSDDQCTNEVTTGLSPVAVNGPGTYNSGNFTPTAVGTYYWIAEYSGDASNSSASGKCGDANESSVVAKKQPAISTDSTDSVTIGGSISDDASLTGATSDATGTITFKLYGPNDANCSGAAVFTSTKNVSGNGTYTSDPFTPTAVGTYRWIASYSGDAKNEAVSGACNDANESTDVVQKQPAIETKATASVTIGSPISDDAILSGATNDAGGTITFHLFSDDQCANEIDTGLSPVAVNGNGTYNSGNFTPTAVGTYYWIAEYSGDSKNLAVSGECGDANESSVVEKAASKVETAQSLTPQDTANLSADAGGTPSGDVTFKLYGPSADPSQPPDCTGEAVYTETVSLDSGSASTSNGADPTTDYHINDASEGTYSWQLIYEGDSTHKPVTSCVEHFTVTIVNGGIVTSS